MIIALTIILLVIAIYIWSSRKKRINEQFSCAEGSFSVSGTKNNFRIEKDGRFEFVVVDGKIVSCVDKLVSKESIAYGGNDNGTA